MVILGSTFASTIDVGQPAWQVIVVILFLVPGLNCTWAIERIAGRILISNTERLIRGVAWSTFIYILASPWLVSVARRIRGGEGVAPLEWIAGGFLLVLFVPLLVGVGAGLLRRTELVRSGMKRLTRVSPLPTAWDVAFSGAGPYFVRVALKNGRIVAGWFADESFAGTFPEPQDLFLERAWDLDEDGALLGPVTRSAGLLIRQESIEFVEFLNRDGGVTHATSKEEEGDDDKR